MGVFCGSSPEFIIELTGDKDDTGDDFFLVIPVKTGIHFHTYFM